MCHLLGFRHFSGSLELSDALEEKIDLALCIDASFLHTLWIMNFMADLLAKGVTVCSLLTRIFLSRLVYFFFLFLSFQHISPFFP